MSSIIQEPVGGALATSPTNTYKDTIVRANPLSLLSRLQYAIHLWAFKALVTTALAGIRLLQPSRFKAIAPTYSKIYPAHPSLPCRVFIPRNFEAGSKIPLYIDIHGGGFALCDPQTDDEFCRYFADHFGYCVVSINYRKAPSYPYPYPVNDCADLARAVLADDKLPVDREKVVVGGFSAGGNLSLAIAQLPGIKDKIRAVVPVYPVVDFTGQTPRKYRVTKDGKEDLLKKSSGSFNWGYVSHETDRREKTLSVTFATRDDLPQKIYFIGAEYDCLCEEANIMAKKLAGIGQDEQAGSEWSRNGIKWEMLPDLQHGFTHVELKGKDELERQRICKALYGRISQWLQQEMI